MDYETGVRLDAVNAKLDYLIERLFGEKKKEKGKKAEKPKEEEGLESE